MRDEEATDEGNPARTGLTKLEFETVGKYSDGQLEPYLYAYRLDGTENGKWLFFDTLKLDFFCKKNKTLRRPYTRGLRQLYLHKTGRLVSGAAYC